jgi:4-hydroxy-tetrahydrodipicolinate synthase
MSEHSHLAGIYAAAITPLKCDFSPDLEALPGLIDFLDHRGCHGILMLGTTGEGPSFSVSERQAIWKIASAHRLQHPNLKLFVGTGTPSLSETIQLTRAAFEMGVDAVVVLPPFYFKNVPEEGLFQWFNALIQHAVPEGRALFYYHIPPITGIPISIEFLSRLKDAYPRRFAGIKDSSSDTSLTASLGEKFGHDLLIYTGNDRYLSKALSMQASGCITAMANLSSPTSRQIWDAHQNGLAVDSLQSRLDRSRTVMEKYSPFPVFVKHILHNEHHFPVWSVRPPLIPMAPEVAQRAVVDWDGTRELE